MIVVDEHGRLSGILTDRDERGKPVGIASIGDLALQRDPDSALADISAAPPNT